jgi:hypothetical protein
MQIAIEWAKLAASESRRWRDGECKLRARLFDRSRPLQGTGWYRLGSWHLIRRTDRNFRRLMMPIATRSRPRAIPPLDAALIAQRAWSGVNQDFASGRNDCRAVDLNNGNPASSGDVATVLGATTLPRIRDEYVNGAGETRAWTTSPCAAPDASCLVRQGPCRSQH